MKKRKELNALIGIGGDNKRKKTKKCSGHRLLRTEPPDSDSESSSGDDEFSNLSGVAAFGKRSYAQCCAICYPLCAFVILAACVMACAGLIWMQIALKEDLDSLKEKLHTMESSQTVSSQEMPKLSEDLKAHQRRLEDIESGDKGLHKLWANITEINRKISLLDSAVNHLKANIKSASDLINLPTTVEELQKSVATIGSTLTSVQHDLKTVQTTAEDQKKIMDALEKNKVKTEDEAGEELGTKSSPSAEQTASNCSSCLPLKQELLTLQDALSKANATEMGYRSQADERIDSLGSVITGLTQRMSFLENSFLLFNASQSSRRNDSKAETLKEKLQLLSALTSKPDSEELSDDGKGTNTKLELPVGDSKRREESGSLKLRGGSPAGTEQSDDGQKLSQEERPWKVFPEAAGQPLLNGSADSEGGRVAQGNGGEGVARPAVGENPPKEEVKRANSGNIASDSVRDGLLQSKSSRPTRRPRFLSQAILKKDFGIMNPTPVFIPGVISAKELEDFFHSLGEDPSLQGVSYEVLKTFFGVKFPDARLLEPYDKDNNQKYSLMELWSAAGV